MKRIFRRVGRCRHHDRKQYQAREKERQAPLAEGHGLLRRKRVRHAFIPLSNWLEMKESGRSLSAVGPVASLMHVKWPASQVVAVTTPALWHWAWAKAHDF